MCVSFFHRKVWNACQDTYGEKEGWTLGLRCTPLCPTHHLLGFVIILHPPCHSPLAPSREKYQELNIPREQPSVDAARVGAEIPQLPRLLGQGSNEVHVLWVSQNSPVGLRSSCSP